MEKKFKKNGVYIFKIKNSLEAEEFYLDKEYEYDIYYFKSKELYDKSFDSDSSVFKKDFFQESVKGLLPGKMTNAVYMNDFYEIIDSNEILENKPIEINKNKFYCIVLEVENIDSLIYNEHNYKQRIFEFKSEQEQKQYIVNKKNTGKLIENQNKNLKVIYDENVTYLVSCGNNIKVLEKDYVLDDDVFNTIGDNEITKVIFYPSLDTYIFNCHEDYIIDATNSLSDFSDKDTTPEEFVDEVEFALENGTKLEYKYIGKSKEASPENLYSTSNESVYIVSTFPITEIVFSDKSIAALSNVAYYKKISDALQNNSSEDIKFIAEFLIKNQILNIQGELLEPYKSEFYVDSSAKINKGTTKTKIKKSSK